jgi:universal stress protein F
MFTSIFVPVDLDESSSWRKAGPTAAELARQHGAKLTIGTVISKHKAAREALWSPAAYREMVELARVRLAQLAEQFAFQPHDVVVGGGAIADGILSLARDAEADLIVLASHRPGAKDFLIGANAAHVVRHAACSVFVMRE